MPEAPTGTITFLFTDIQGSTSMWERDARRMQAALARHDEILKGVVEDHGGHVFKMVGDACYAAFSSAPEALEAALAAQRAIFKEPWDDRLRVRVRMALHTGEAEERDGDYFGPPLNRVARLLSAGHGGQTLLSRATREQLGERLAEGAYLRDMGEHRLKDLKERERIFQLVVPDLPSEFPPLKTLEAPSEDDRYRLIKQIGSGGMAEVYLAYDEALEREVAFKVLNQKYAENKEAIERFRREARNAASLAHPNIVAIHDRGETEDGTYYIVMEYMEGGTLEDLIKQEGPLPPSRATEITLQVAKALQVAHEKGVIHRDIKPQNILLSKSGEAKVADYGIARAATATTMTQAGSVMGTVHYISPEQALGEPATPKSDLYSLGVVIYEMLTGELPYDAETPAGIIMKHVGGLSRSPKETNPEVPEELDAITARLLAKDPEDRYPDASALVEDLERVREGLPLDAATRERRHSKKPGGGGFRRRGVLAALALVVISVGVVAIVALNRGGGLFAQTQEMPEPEQPGDVSGPLSPGRYATNEFRPEFSFRINQGGWRASYPEMSDVFALTPGQSASGYTPTLGFIRAKLVFPPDGQDLVNLGPNDPREPAPDNMVSWLQNHPYLSASDPVPVTIGGKRGVRLDVAVFPLPKDYSRACETPASPTASSPWFYVTGDRSPETPCIFLLSFANGAGLPLYAGDKSRLIIFENIGGETVVIAATASNQEFAEFLPKMQGMLKTVEWAV